MYQPLGISILRNCQLQNMETTRDIKLKEQLSRVERMLYSQDSEMEELGILAFHSLPSKWEGEKFSEVLPLYDKLRCTQSRLWVTQRRIARGTFWNLYNELKNDNRTNKQDI